MERHAFERRRTPCAEFPNDNRDLHHGTIWVCLELRSAPARELPTECALPQIAAPRAAPTPPADRQTQGPSNSEAPTAIAELESGDGPTVTTELEGGVSPATAEFDAELPDDEGEPIEIVDELCFDDALDDLPPESDVPEAASEPSRADPFAQLVAALADVALSLGAAEDGVACLEALFGQARLDGLNANDRALEALVAGNVIAQGARGFTRSSHFTAKVVAWQGILRGESEDFSLPDGGALEPLDEWAADLLARILGPPARVEGIRRDLRRRGIAAFGLVAEAA
jgi:hypothetical protein